MDGSILRFVIWAIVGCAVAGIGVSAFFQKKAVGFWANVKAAEVDDVKGYNRATGGLLVLYGVVLIALGLPLLSRRAALYSLLSVLGVVLETIAAMAVYSLAIEKKYRANRDLRK